MYQGQYIFDNDLSQLNDDSRDGQFSQCRQEKKLLLMDNATEGIHFVCRYVLVSVESTHFKVFEVLHVNYK